MRSPIETASKIKVPTFLIGGSNDIFQRDEPLLYEQVKNNANTKLVILPGSHVGAVQTALNSAANSTSNGAPGAASLLLQWFDQYLKGMNTGAASLPNVTQYPDRARATLPQHVRPPDPFRTQGLLDQLQPGHPGPQDAHP